MKAVFTFEKPISMALEDNSFDVTIEFGAFQNGADGLSAYQLWLKEGNTGSVSDFLSSITGPQGPKGAQGDKGDKGDKGTNGANGTNGMDGMSVNWKGDYVSGVSYVINDAVHYDGTSYIATATTTSAPSSLSGWDILAAAGEKGDQGIQGIQGAPGLNINIKDSVVNVSDLPAGILNDCRLVESTGDWYYHNGASWINVGHIQGPQGIQGEKGDQGVIGATGSAATITIGTITGIEAGLPPYVTNTGTSTAAILNFWIPKGNKGEKGDTGAQGLQGLQGLKGDKGDRGDDGTDGADGINGTNGVDGISPTISVGSVITGAAGSQATVTNTGTQSAAIFNFTIPQGAKGDNGTNGTNGTNGINGTNATVTIGTTTTGSAGSNAYVTNSGTASNAVLNFIIPRGATGATGATGANGTNGVDGAAATIAVGTVTTGAAGSSASITNSGTSTNAIFDFVIPKGDTGASGGSATTGSYSEITALKSASSLIPETEYIINDYRTIYIQPDSLSVVGFSGDAVLPSKIYTLKLRARTSSAFHSDAKIISVRDSNGAYNEEMSKVCSSWKINYSIDNDTALSPLVSSASSLGWIYYMKDEKGNEADYDFKNVRFRRYTIDGASISAWASGTVYSFGSLVRYSNMIFLCVAKSSFSSSSNPTSSTTSPRWVPISNNYSNNYFIPESGKTVTLVNESQATQDTVLPKSSTYAYFYTFNDMYSTNTDLSITPSCKNNSVRITSSNNACNIVFRSSWCCENKVSASVCTGNTFQSSTIIMNRINCISCTDNAFIGTGSYNMNNNIIDCNSFDYNLMSYTFTGDTDSFSRNRINCSGFSFNVFDSATSDNQIGSYEFMYNSIKYLFGYNTFTASADGSNYSVNGNNVSDNFKGNTISVFKYNFIDRVVADNEFKDCAGSTIGSYTAYNVFKRVSSSTILNTSRAIQYSSFEYVYGSTISNSSNCSQAGAIDNSTISGCTYCNFNGKINNGSSISSCTGCTFLGTLTTKTISSGTDKIYHLAGALTTV